ncbi:MAG: acyl-CoA thioesterase [Clostridiales bacterium]|nr:acyl-CoA thioesterase [Clostridiales bacterium]
MTGKRVCESITEHVEIVLPAHINGYERLFGGKLMQWIDVVAGVVARRHSNREVTTAAIDHLEFQSPAYVNNTITLKGCVTYTGKTSMEVRVDTFLESLDGTRKRINRAYLVMVALDEEQNPTSVPPLILETESEKIEWENAIRRREMRKMREKARF